MTDLAVGFYTTLTVFLVFGLVVLGIMIFGVRTQVRKSVSSKSLTRFTRFIDDTN